MKYHHEYWDGTGYPNSISGEFTPLEGRILRIADAFSAMTIKRVFCEPITLEDAIEELKSKSGTQFDPTLSALFIEHLNEKLKRANLAEV